MFCKNLIDILNKSLKMLLNILRHICFTFSYYSFLTTRTCYLSTVGIEPLTIRMVASLANHYTNMTYLKSINKKYTFLPMGFMF